MGLREDAVNAFARLLGVSSPVEKAASSAQPAATQTAGELPLEWQLATYAPGWPIQPAVRPEESAIPREIDYPISVNATLQPRTAYGLMPFSALKEAYESVAEIRMPISTLQREMMIFTPHLIDKDGGEIKDHPFEWLTVAPDRVSPFDVWITRFLKSSQIFDAGSFFFEYEGAELKGIRYIDGSTLFIFVDEHGQVPLPKQVSSDPAVREKYIKKAQEWVRKGKPLPKTTPAFCQVIKGTPFGWYDQDQVWYKPRSRRYDAPYGETAIEQSWAWILIVANITGFALAYYREGNTPEGLYTAPEGWSLERIAAFEAKYNERMSSGPAERRRGRWLPYGSDYKETKQPEFPIELYNQASNTISLFFGVPPSEYGRVPGEGLGGAGFEEAMQSALFRMGIYPNKVFIEGALNEVLKRAGVTDAKFELAFPVDEIDPEKRKKSILELFGSGLITFNSALAQLGQDRIPGGDVHVIVEYGGIRIIEESLPGNKLYEDAQAKEEAARRERMDNNLPINPNSPQRQEPKDEKQRAEDLKLAEQLIRERSLSPGNKKFSLPPNGKAGKVNIKKALEKSAGDGCMVALDLPADVGRQLQDACKGILPEGADPMPIDEMHITLFYPGEIESLGFDRMQLISACNEFVRTHAPLVGVIGGVARFHGNEQSPLVALFDCPDLPQFRQDLVEHLHQNGIMETARDHGFIPHITLAYLPAESELEEEAKISPIPLTFREIVVAWGDEWHHIPLQAAINIQKMTVPELAKHCGVCVEDDDYYGAPVTRETQFLFPENDHTHANEVEIVALTPEGLPARPALWKPEGGELEGLQWRVGGPMYLREEAAYLLDRSLNFYLVPVAYVTPVGDEWGVAIHYTRNAPPSKAVWNYAPSWVEKAAILDHIMGQLDRHSHNYLTHPDEPDRMVLIDNGMSFPVDDLSCFSPFCAAFHRKALSEEVLQFLKVCVNDLAAWNDIRRLVGEQSADRALNRARQLLELGMISVPVEVAVIDADLPTSGSGGG